MIIANEYQIKDIKSEYEAKLKAQNPYNDRYDHTECKKIQNEVELEVETLQGQLDMVIEENKRVRLN
jgi:archaellum component FlaC